MATVLSQHGCPSLGEPRVIVGLDFGTTFSGFAYALKNDPGKVFAFEDWPLQTEANGRPYCKTSSALWYKPEAGGRKYELKAWGWPAVLGLSKELEDMETNDPVTGNCPSEVEFARRLGRLSLGRSPLQVTGRRGGQGKTAAAGQLVTLFKLHLASEASSPSDSTIRPPLLPQGITLETAVGDYLSQMKGFVLEELKKRFGSHLGLEDIQWALTVPAIWDERAKQRMKSLAHQAGLIQNNSAGLFSDNGGSPHPLHIVLEPEAAAIRCQELSTCPLKVGDKFIVVDAGGGTVDLVGQQVAPGGMTKEISASIGGLCGGACVDEAFLEFLKQRIGPSFDAFSKRNPAAVLKMMQRWQDIKCSFRGENAPFIFDLPELLVEAWEACDKEASEDEIELTLGDMREIFNPTVEKVLDLIDKQLRVVKHCKALIVVGGFSQSPYLMKRIRKRFSKRVKSIQSPPNPGAAVCHGAVLYALNPYQVLSRISRKTYGIAVLKDFMIGVHERRRLLLSSNGRLYCRGCFLAFVKKDQAVDVHATVKHLVSPIEPDLKEIGVAVFSTFNTSPRYIDDPGVTLEGIFKLAIPDTSLGVARAIEVSMWFGRTSLEVSAKPLNFGSGEEASMAPVTFAAGI